MVSHGLRINLLQCAIEISSLLVFKIHMLSNRHFLHISLIIFFLSEHAATSKPSVYLTAADGLKRGSISSIFEEPCISWSFELMS
jgi:hypothetical protein